MFKSVQSSQSSLCSVPGCGREIVPALAFCECHAAECTCLCVDCESRGVHYCHAEDGSDYGEACPNEVDALEETAP